MNYQKLLDEFNKENGTYFTLKQGVIANDTEKMEAIKTYHVISLMQQKYNPSDARIGYVKFVESDLISREQLEDALKEVIKKYGKRGYVSAKVEFKIPEDCRTIHMSDLDLDLDKGKK